MDEKVIFVEHIYGYVGRPERRYFIKNNKQEYVVIGTCSFYVVNNMNNIDTMKIKDNSFVIYKKDTISFLIKITLT